MPEQRLAPKEVVSSSTEAAGERRSQQLAGESMVRSVLVFAQLRSAVVR
jgi:hypothetical protein